MQLIGLARLGRDAELRHLDNGDAIASLNLAFNYGKRDEAGQRPSQWVQGKLWGTRAEALIDYLQKGSLVYVQIGDPHIKTFDKADGSTGYALEGRIEQIELTGRPPR